MSKKNLAVSFPGFGYNGDKPLLYYSKKLASEKGYEILDIKYDLLTPYKEMENDKDRDEKVFKIAVGEAMKSLSEVNISEYEKVLFIGKSLGTVVAGYCAKEMGIDARHIVFTPVPDTFDRLKEGCGIVFHGTEDPLCDNNVARDKCKELGLELIEVKGANHSLEIHDVKEDLRRLVEVMERVKKEM